MELLVIRHGQSEADILGRMEGRADFFLTGLGEKQAELAAEYIFENHIPDYIVCSPLKRAARTAGIIGLRTGVMVKTFPELMEFNNGLIAGLTFEEAENRYPTPAIKLPHESYYEQETLIEFRARAETILSRIINEYPADSRVAIVAHGGIINMLFRSFLKLPINTDISIQTGDAGIHLWKVEGEKRKIVFMNKLEHLKELMP